MIDRNDKLSISRQAKLLGISRGSVYYLPQGVSEAEMALMRQIDELHLEHPFMGVGQLERHLRRLGFEVGRQHVRTLMLRMDIQAMVPQPGSSKPAPGHKIYPYLLRNVAVERADHVWALDTTYIPMRQGFVYLTAILDVATRRVMAHKVATTLEACHAREIMQEALSRYGTPEIISTDQGSQFTAQEFTDVVLTSGARLSMDGRGAWRDNVFVERMWRSVKYEHVYKHA
jgi:putative transposase